MYVTDAPSGFHEYLQRRKGNIQSRSNLFFMKITSTENDLLEESLGEFITRFRIELFRAVIRTTILDRD